MSTFIVTATVALLGWLAVYAFACWVWPFRACRRCDGSGRRRSPSGRAFRLCPRCRGTGRRLRAGRWLYNAVQRARKEGTS
jgi:hypothetical protein